MKYLCQVKKLKIYQTDNGHIAKEPNGKIIYHSISFVEIFKLCNDDNRWLSTRIVNGEKQFGKLDKQIWAKVTEKMHANWQENNLSQLIRYVLADDYYTEKLVELCENTKEWTND